MIYLDSSALITFTVERKNWKQLKQFFSAHREVRTCTSPVGFVETVRICDEIGTYPDLMASLARDHAQISLGDEIRNGAAALPGKIRYLDAIHVASAQILGSELTALVTYDKRVAEVARATGLPVAMPCAGSS